MSNSPLWIEITGNWIDLQKITTVAFGSQYVVFNSQASSFSLKFKNKDEAEQITKFIINQLERNFSHYHFEMKEPEVPKKKEKEKKEGSSGYFLKDGLILK